MKDEVIISQGKRSLWHNIIAAFFYALGIIAVYFFFFGFESSIPILGRKFDAFELILYSFVIAFYFSVVKSYHFDFTNNLYKKQQAFLWFKLGKWNPLPELEYISVFQKEEGVYEINLWYIGNKHFKIYHMFDEAEAMKVGKQLAISLRIDLLDATVANDSKWIEL
jgi:hypothetical protein